MHVVGCNIPTRVKFLNPRSLFLYRNGLFVCVVLIGKYARNDLRNGTIKKKNMYNSLMDQ